VDIKIFQTNAFFISQQNCNLMKKSNLTRFNHWFSTILLLLGLALPMAGFTQTQSVTFCVDYTCVASTPGFAAQQIYFVATNSFSNLTNTGNNIWCTTLSFPTGSNVSYRFHYAAAGGAGGLENVTGLSCASNGARTLTVADAPQSVTFAWQSCSSTPVCPPPVAPTVAAPAPTCAQANVISVYSDTYTNNIAGTNFNPNWGQPGFGSATTFTLSGNEMRYYPNMSYQGIALGSHQNLSSFQTLRIDIWSANCSSIDIYLVANVGGEKAVRRSLTLNSWNSIEIALTDYSSGAGAIPLTAIKEFKFVAITPGSGANIFVDNIYFANSSCSPAPPANVNVTICGDFTCVPGYDAPRMVVDGMGVVNLNTNAGNNIRCATLSMAPGSQISYFFQYSIPGSAPAENLTSLIGQTCVDAGGTRRVLTVPSAAQTFTYAWESCSATPNCPAPINVTICGDFSCQSGYEAPRMVVDGMGVVNLNTNAGNNVRCATLSLIPGSQISYFFQYSIPGGAPAENLTSLIGQTCVNAGGTRRVLTVPSAAQTFTYAWESCSATQVCPAPTVVAPAPTCAQANVISVYSDTYTNIAGTNFNPNWGQSGFTSATTFTLSGNQMRYYPNMNYQGIALGSHQMLDSFQTLRLDIWSANCSSIDIYLVTAANGERAIRRSLTLNSWNSLEIPLADYAAQGIPLTAIKEFKFVTITPGSAANIYVDNIYFSKVNCTDVTPPTLNCSNLTVTFNGENSIPLVASQLATATDNFGTASISINTSSVTCQQVGQSVPVTVTARDATGNTSTCISTVTVAGLPCGWSQNPNGVNCTGGNSISYNAATGVYSATSTNCYYGPSFTSDETVFAQRTLCGNGSITARVTGINPLASGWAGIVMRESNAAGAKKAQLMTNLGSDHRREFRTTTNGSAQPQQFPSQSRYWLRITRAGNQFTMFVSSNGISWFPVGTQNIAMPNCIEMGLVVTNYTANSAVTATFSGVSFTGSNPIIGANMNEVTQSAEQPYSFEVYPNPTGAELNLDLTQYIGRSVRIETYSLEGKLLRFTELDEVQTTLERLDLTGFQNGMYLVKVKSAGLPEVTRRVVKQ